jgi:hypothetical protein
MTKAIENANVVVFILISNNLIQKTKLKFEE